MTDAWKRSLQSSEKNAKMRETRTDPQQRFSPYEFGLFSSGVWLQFLEHLKSRQTKKAANNLWHLWHKISFLSFKDYF